MKPYAHLIQGVASSLVLYPLAGNDALIFGASVIVIDLDHFIEYYNDTGRISVRGLLTYHDILVNNLENYLGLNVFHTLECYLVLFLASLYFPPLKLILAGFLFHHLFDEIELISRKRPFVRAFSILEYFIRKKVKKYYTSIHEILENTNHQSIDHETLRKYII
ncbi:hypothetical protein ACFL1R_07330 [Candidatus Latescibacterota bacterium]